MSRQASESWHNCIMAGVRVGEYKCGIDNEVISEYGGAHHFASQGAGSSLAPASTCTTELRGSRPHQGIGLGQVQLTR